MLPKANVHIKNKRATFDYLILDRYTAGLQLYGTEIKSIRDGKAGLVDTYCTFVGGELWVKGMHIATYAFGSYNNHEAKRDRKLLQFVNTGYETLHLYMGYDGTKNKKTCDSGFDMANAIINRCELLYPNNPSPQVA